MSTPYTIYLINKSQQQQTFWCFLAAPEALSGPGVFANSSANLTVIPNAPGFNTFKIPVQYVIGAGASNHRVAAGLNLEVASGVQRQVDLGQEWDANYVTISSSQGPQGPSLTQDSAKPLPTEIVLNSNAFNQGSNENQYSWFGSMSFGITTAQGFIGMSWSPPPNDTKAITPLLKFYVATGSFGSNELASWTDVSRTSATLLVPDSFRYEETTVTYNPDGTFTVTPGKPDESPSATFERSGDATFDRSGDTGLLIQSHRALCEAHLELIDLVERRVDGPGTSDFDPRWLGAEPDQTDTVTKVQWGTKSFTADVGDPVLTGTITVATALAATFAVFVLGGLLLKITWTATDGLSAAFEYSGTKSAAAVKKVFAAVSTAYFFKQAPLSLA
jgi:hypothetical protein